MTSAFPLESFGLTPLSNAPLVELFLFIQFSASSVFSQLPMITDEVEDLAVCAALELQKGIFWVMVMSFGESIRKMRLSWCSAYTKVEAGSVNRTTAKGSSIRTK